MSEKENIGTYIPADTTDGACTEVFPYAFSAGAKEFPPYINPDEVLAAAIALFARVPGLAQHLLERGEREVGPSKVAPFFDYLFIASSSPAVGANYNVVGYRLRDMDEMYLVNRTTN